MGALRPPLVVRERERKKRRERSLLARRRADAYGPKSRDNTFSTAANKVKYEAKAKSKSKSRCPVEESLKIHRGVYVRRDNAEKDGDTSNKMAALYQDKERDSFPGEMRESRTYMADQQKMDDSNGGMSDDGSEKSVSKRNLYNKANKGQDREVKHCGSEE